MKQILTYLRHNWEALVCLMGIMLIAFVGGVAYSMYEIDQTIEHYIEANGCPVEGEDW